MATSGTTTYSIGRDSVITEALKLIEVLEEGQSATATQISDCTPALQLMVKSLAAQGLHLWKRNSVSITLTAATATYTFGPSNWTSSKVLRLLDVNIKDTSSSIETPLTGLSLTEYEQLSNKTTTGTPVQYYFNPYRATSTITLWPVPDTSAAANKTLEVVYQSHFEDMTSSSTEFDFPIEWMDAIVYQLAVRIAPFFGYPLDKRKFLKAEAAEKLMEAKDFDREITSVYLQPSPKRGF